MKDRDQKPARDARDPKKSDHEDIRSDVDEGMQAAELQVGSDDEAQDPSRFEPDRNLGR